MPIVAQSVLERKKYLPTVYEAFGVLPDKWILRCQYREDRLVWPKTGSSSAVPARIQCTAEFCYKPPENSFSDTDDRRSVIATPFEKTINLEVFNEGGVVDVNSLPVNFVCRVRCKICHMPVGVIEDNWVDLTVVQDWRPEVDSDARIYESIDDLESYFQRALYADRDRQTNIPFNVAKYKKLNKIPDVKPNKPKKRNTRNSRAAARTSRVVTRSMLGKRGRKYSFRKTLYF